MLSPPGNTEHASCPFHQCLVHSFYNSILLGCIWSSLLSCYTTLLIELFKFLTTKLSTVICPQHLYLLLCLVFHQSLEFFKPVKDFRFLLKEIYPCIPREVI